MSPELFDPEVEDHRPTEWSDSYALGMVIYEVLSGHVPFYSFANRVVSGKILKGDRPERPQEAEGVLFTDEVWQVLGFCWTTQPEMRPSIEDLLQRLGKFSRSWIPPSPQLLAGAPTVDSLAWGSSDIIAAESSDASNASPSQPSEKLGQEASARTFSQVSYPSSIQMITDVDAMILGSGDPSTPTSFANFARLVSFSFGPTDLFSRPFSHVW